jgi:hypothetical protein
MRSSGRIGVAGLWAEGGKVCGALADYDRALHRFVLLLFLTACFVGLLLELYRVALASTATGLLDQSGRKKKQCCAVHVFVACSAVTGKLARQGDESMIK